MKTIGIDIGGMSIKGMITDKNGIVYAEDRAATGSELGGDNMCENIATLIHAMMVRASIEKEEIKGVGIGSPGLIDSKNGVIVFAGNLGLRNYPLAATVERMTGLPVKITNDANAAALGEAKFGAGKQYSDSIMVTLGTGVGGGIVIDGKLFEGYKSAGTEIGHMVIVKDGIPCTCGRKGCFEAYSSATALMRKTKEVMADHPESAMWRSYTLETVSGKTAFDYYETDIWAKEVVDWYVEHLACGILNLACIFRPQIVMLGGGVSAQDKRLTDPVQAIVDKEIFAGQDYAPVKVVKATLGNRAGAYGAAALQMD